MTPCSPLRFTPLAAIVIGLLASATAAGATQVWSGRTLAFSKPAYADWTNATYQDRITARVWLTRASTQGLFNIAQEASYGETGFLSPVDTEWATGDAVNHASLSFQTWTDWTGLNPPSTVGVNAVVHLIQDDIYIDIRFDSWGNGHFSPGGEFSYHRGEPHVVPTATSTWGTLKALYR